MAEVRVPVEMTRSRRGGHAARRIAVYVKPGGKARIIGEPSEISRDVATYSRGRAGYARIDVRDGVVVVFRLVKNTSGRITGEVTVIDASGRPALEMVLRRRKLRRRCGDPSLVWAVEAALRTLGLDAHVRRVNTRTGC